MTVHAGTAGLLGIVQVHSLEVLPPHYPSEFLEDCVEAASFGEKAASVTHTQIISCGKSVAGVDADSHAGFVLHLVNDFGKMFEAEAEVASLPCRILDHSGNSRGLVKRHIYALGYPAQAFRFGNLPQMASRMEIEPVKAQLPATLHLVEEGGAGLAQPLVFGMPEIDQVTVVGKNAVGNETQFFAILLEEGDALLRKGRGDPLALVFRKDGESVRAYGRCIERGVFHPSRRAYMCSEIFHDQ